MLFSIGTFLILLFLILAAALFILWLSMLIDCLKRPDDNFEYCGNNAKLIWILVIIFTGLIGALIYYFLIKKTDEEEKVNKMNYETEDVTAAKIKNVEFVLGSREYGIKYLNGDKLHNSALIFIVNL